MADIHETLVPSKAPDGHALAVDLSDPASYKIHQQMLQEDRLRDRTRAAYPADADPEQATVYLECSDLGDCVPSGTSGTAGTPPQKLSKIASDVESTMLTGSMKTSLDQSVFNEISLEHTLGEDQQTYQAPLLAGNNNGYWETVSRPYERLLIKDLAASNGTITNAELMKTALKVCNNDTQLAVVTVANFTKNMAGIERRQFDPAQIDPSMRASYQKSTIDSIFHRMESLTDNPRQTYNKEGAMYHFYGALLAGTQWGHIADAFVGYDNSALGEAASTDRVKNRAGSLGASAGSFYYDIEKAEGFR
jgi:hypothetical protein